MPITERFEIYEHIIISSIGICKNKYHNYKLIASSFKQEFRELKDEEPDKHRLASYNIIRAKMRELRKTIKGLKNLCLWGC